MSETAGAPDSADDAVELLRSPPGLSLDGRVAWITGASRGLGRALAFAFAGAGADVLLSARSAEALEETAARIEEAGRRAVVCPASVSEPEDLARATELATDTWGRLDVLVNNAGISPAFAPAERIDLDDFSATLETNVTGTLRCCRAALPLLRDSTLGASVVNISSIHAAHAHERLVAYSASKAGVDLLTRTLALEWAPDAIRVNCVAPGYIDTDMTRGLQRSERHYENLRSHIPFGRFAEVGEIVPAVLFCASDAARYMTGATLTVDGGWSAR